MKKLVLLFSLFALLTFNALASKILIPMDSDQSNHLKANGIAFYSLEKNNPIQWLLNYRGGSFLLENIKAIEEECIIRNVSYQIIADVQAVAILNEIADPEVNMYAVKLE